MKKCYICLCMFFMILMRARAQEDIQTMLKQIAKLEIYIVELEKGYQIAKEGLDMIGEIKKGEFGLHTIFFNSLQTVSPAVAKYSKIAEIIADQISIASEFKALIKKIGNPVRLTENEMNYISAVYTNMSNECSKCLSELIAITTDGKLEMTDDERIRRIDGIWKDMKDKQSFTQSFTGKTTGLLNFRETHRGETELLKTLE